MSVIENIIDIPAEYEKTVFGQFDYNIKKIEKTLHVTIISRDGDLKIIGGETATKRAKSVFMTIAAQAVIRPIYLSSALHIGFVPYLSLLLSTV